MDLQLSKVSEDASTITLGWTPPGGVEWYTLFAGYKRVSNHAPVDKHGTVFKQARFAKSPEPQQVVATVQTSPGVFETAVGTYSSSVEPPPTPAGGKVDGVGIVRYAGTLANTSHLDAYDIIIADWSEASRLARQPGMTFAYRNLGPPGFSPINLSNPGAFVNEVVQLIQQNPGLDGVFLDNCAEKDQGSQLPFMRSALPPLKQRGIKVMLNVVGQNPGQDDGSADARWIGVVGPLATHLMEELWVQGRGGPELYNVRNRGSASYADYWDEWVTRVPKAAHDTGCALVGMTYRSIQTGIYGRASLLLYAKEGDCFCWNPDDVPEGTDPYDPRWMQSLGKALDPIGSNPRRFEHGTVSVDPVKGTATIS